MKRTVDKALNIKYRFFVFLGLLAFLLTTQPVLAAEEPDDKWEFDGNIYLWVADIQMQDPDGNNNEISFNDLVQNLDMVFMGGLGARKDKLGYQIDAIYLDLTDDDNNTLVPGLLTLTDVELTATILTPKVTYRVVEDGQLNLDILGGVRYLHMDLNFKFREISNEGDDGSVTNGIVGFKGDI